MTSLIIDIKPQDLDTKSKRGKYTISVIGCRAESIFDACFFAEQGFRVICVDADQARTSNLAKGRIEKAGHQLESRLMEQVKKGQISVTNDFVTVASKSQIILFTIPIEIGERGRIDRSTLELGLKTVGTNLRLGSLVLITTLLAPGETRQLAQTILENTSGMKTGKEFALAYSPNLESESLEHDALKQTPRILGADDARSLSAASALLGSVTTNPVSATKSTKLSEAAVLFNLAHSDVDIALAYELAVFCEKAGIDYTETWKLVSNQELGEMSKPILINGDKSRRIRLLLEEAERNRVKLLVSKAAQGVNRNAVKHVYALVKDGFRSGGKSLSRARISVLGVSDTLNDAGFPKQAAKEIAELLDNKGARTTVYDPYLSEEELGQIHRRYSRSLSDALENADCLIILSAHDQFKKLSLARLKAMMRKPATIVDLEGIIDPADAEKEEFIYRGFGRGVWSK